MSRWKLERCREKYIECLKILRNSLINGNKKEKNSQIQTGMCRNKRIIFILVFNANSIGYSTTPPWAVNSQSFLIISITETREQQQPRQTKPPTNNLNKNYYLNRKEVHFQLELKVQLKKWCKISKRNRTSCKEYLCKSLTILRI